MHPNEFIALFEQQYPNHRWADVEVRMYVCYCYGSWLSSRAQMGTLELKLSIGNHMISSAI